ncbi:MAG: replication initiator protein A [Pirellulales bacterium]|nr:replication initiator protein A [Pirellulales bacterium]
METHGERAHLKRMGRDEMNLAEFPLALLADRVPPGCKTLVFEDQIRDKGHGQDVVRRLTISACDKFGLPTALDDEVILGLVQLSKADNFTNREVPFSRYKLIHLLNWRDEGKSYSRLEESLKRWVGVTLYYDNAWWDKARKRWVNAHFHLLDNLTLYQRLKSGERSTRDNNGGPLSSFTWNEIIFRSFRAGNLRKVDLEFYKTLKSAVAKRLYRFLDKHFYFGGRQRYNLARFAREHVGLLSQSYDAAQLKRRLTPGIRELEEAGYLEALPAKERFVCVRRGEWEVVFIRAVKPAQKEVESPQPAGLEAQLVDRGVTASVANRLVRDFPAETINAKLNVFDRLAARRDARISKNPAGYLVESIRKDYTPPPEIPTTVSLAAVKSNPPEQSKARKRIERPEDKKFYVEQQQIEEHLAGLSAERLAELEVEALKSSPSFIVERFRDAVASGSEALTRQYRRCLLERHLRTIFNLMAEPACTSSRKAIGDTPERSAATCQQG